MPQVQSGDPPRSPFVPYLIARRCDTSEQHTSLRPQARASRLRVVSIALPAAALRLQFADLPASAAGERPRRRPPSDAQDGRRSAFPRLRRRRRGEPPPSMPRSFRFAHARRYRAGRYGPRVERFGDPGTSVRGPCPGRVSAPSLQSRGQDLPLRLSTPVVLNQTTTRSQDLAPWSHWTGG